MDKDIKYFIYFCCFAGLGWGWMLILDGPTFWGLLLFFLSAVTMSVTRNIDIRDYNFNRIAERIDKDL